MRGCLQWHRDISMSSSRLPDSSKPSALVQKRRALRRMSSPREVTDSLSDSFPVCRLFLGSPASQCRNETLLNRQRTKEYIPHIPRGQAALHTGNTSRPRPAWTDNKYHLNVILSNFNKLTRYSKKSAWAGCLSLSPLTKQQHSGSPGLRWAH